MTQTRAFVYCRISLARFGDTTKTDEQERICRADADRRGWHVVAVHTDNSQSAWRANRKRPGWDAMLAGIEAGEADAIEVYHGDRLIRQPWDLEVLLRLAQNKGILLGSPTGVRDLGQPDDQFVLRIEAAMACRESDNISRRRKTHNAWMAANGLTPNHGRGYGYHKGAIVPAEAAVISSAAQRITAGASLVSVARDLATRGVRGRNGALFTPTSLRVLLTQPRIAGLMPNGIGTATWEPILSREDWEAVTAVLTASKARYAGRSNGRRWLLTGIATCGECGNPLQITAAEGWKRIHPSGGRCNRDTGSCPHPHTTTYDPTVRSYACTADGCRRVLRSRQMLDEYVITRVLAKLSDPAGPAGRVPASPVLATEYVTLTEEHADTVTAITDPGRGNRLPLLLARLDAIEARLLELRELSAGDVRARLAATHAGITRDQWDALPLGTRRALVTACFTIKVLRVKKRGPGFRTSDVVLEAQA